MSGWDEWERDPDESLGPLPDDDPTPGDVPASAASPSSAELPPAPGRRGRRADKREATNAAKVQRATDRTAAEASWRREGLRSIDSAGIVFAVLAVVTVGYFGIRAIVTDDNPAPRATGPSSSATAPPAPQPSPGSAGTTSTAAPGSSATSTTSVAVPPPAAETVPGGLPTVYAGGEQLPPPETMPTAPPPPAQVAEGVDYSDPLAVAKAWAAQRCYYDYAQGLNNPLRRSAVFQTSISVTLDAGTGDTAAGQKQAAASKLITVCADPILAIISPEAPASTTTVYVVVSAVKVLAYLDQGPQQAEGFGQTRSLQRQSDGRWLVDRQVEAG